jgi:hypothetical protein
MRFVWGPLAIIIGILIMRYNFQIVGIFGTIGWAENHLSSGGTYILYKLIGLGVVIVAMLYMFGSADFLVKPLSPVFGG